MGKKKKCENMEIDLGNLCKILFFSPELPLLTKTLLPTLHEGTDVLSRTGTNGVSGHTVRCWSASLWFLV